MSRDRSRYFGCLLVNALVSVRFLYLGGTRGGNVQAIAWIVSRSFESPCRRIRLTVSAVPVDGDQVMLNGVPTGIDSGREVKLKGF